MKAKQIIACALIINLIFSCVQGMKPKQEKTAETKNINKQKESFIRYGKTDFPVSKKVLEQFKLYKTSKEFEKTAETETKSVIENNQIVWDITPLIISITTEKPELFTNILLKVASNKLDPYKIPQKTLFMIIKIADLLRNKQIMQKCTPALIEKLTQGKIGQLHPIRTFTHKSKIRVKGIVLLPDGKRFLSYSSDSSIKLWNINKNKAIRTFNEHTEWVLGIILLPGTKQFLSYSGDGTIKLWNINKNKSIRTFQDQNEMVLGIVLLPGTQQFLSYSYNGIIKLWNINKNKSILTFQEHKKTIHTIVPLPDAKRFLADAHNDTIKLWNINDPNKSIRTFAKPNKKVRGIVLLPDAQQFLSYAYNGIIKLWNLNKNESIHTFKEHVQSVDGIVLLPGAQQFLSYAYGDTIKLWNINQNKSVNTFNNQTKTVLGIVLLPGAQQFLSYSYDGIIKLWDISAKFVPKVKRYGYSFYKNNESRTFGEHDKQVLGIVLLPGTQQFLSYSDDRTIKLWDINKKKSIRTFNDTDTVSGIVLLPETQQFLSYSKDGTINLWDINPFANLTFEQIKLCFTIFTSNKIIEIKIDSYDYKTFTSLPKSLQEAIKKIKIG